MNILHEEKFPNLALVIFIKSLNEACYPFDQKMCWKLKGGQSSTSHWLECRNTANEDADS
jgi:hypothetical protein